MACAAIVKEEPTPPPPMKVVLEMSLEEAAAVEGLLSKIGNKDYSSALSGVRPLLSNVYNALYNAGVERTRDGYGELYLSS